MRLPPPPAMYFGDTSRLGRPCAKDPAVVRFGGRYLLYYSIPPFAHPQPGDPPGWGIGIAESSDLDYWRRIGEVLPSQPCEAKGICAPGAHVLDGQLHLFYQTYGNFPHDALCHAVSDDGVHFDKDPTNPIFAPTGNWNNGRAIDADVLPWQGDLLLFFSTRDPSGKIQMTGAASAPLGSGYGRDTWRQISLDGPVLAPELPWETRCIEASALCEHDGRLYLFYAGGYNNEPQQIGCAAAIDGDPLQMERLSHEPLLPCGEAGAWNASESGHPFVFTDDDGSQHLFFQGNADNGHTWFLSRRRIEWTPEGPTIIE